MSFNEDFFESFERNVIFKDFSSKYFRQTLVPKSWSGETSSALFSNNADEEGVLEGLVNYLDQNAPRSMVVIDSLTDLVLNQKIDPKDLVAVLRGMQRVSKKWGGVVYLLLTKDIIDDRLQRMIMDSVDGALVFEWSRFVTSSKRQRYLYVEKFMSILPHLDRERIARFATTVTAQSGLVVIDTERIG
jgi:archaellum biogenesis ATPase FlaH